MQILLLVTDKNPSGISGRGGGRNYFVFNLQARINLATDGSAVRHITDYATWPASPMDNGGNMKSK